MIYDFQNLQLRLSSDSDVEFIFELESHKENFQFITPWSKERHRLAFLNKDLVHGIIRDGDKDVGFFILSGVENPNQSIEFMRIVIGPKGSGFGRKSLKAIKAYCFEQLKTHRIWLDVKTFNHKAQNLYLSEGFVIEGTLRDCIKVEDKFESLVVMSILKTEYKNN